MDIHFYKFHGNGNDFIIIDGRSNALTLSSVQINKLCNRRFGVGADGLMLLANSEEYDFKMMYYNSDGKISSMCGNGGRCIAAYAYMLGITGKKINFEAYDGVHEAVIEAETIPLVEYDVSLHMANVNFVEKNNDYYFLDTGSPHYVTFVSNVAGVNVTTDGKTIRKSEPFARKGTNVDFVELRGDDIFVRTYERGVEKETLSCGTGVTASAIAAFYRTGKTRVDINTKGGDFTVDFIYDTENEMFTNIWLRGPAHVVFEGDLHI